MRKDYVPVSDTAPADEAAFVEQFWTRAWDGRRLSDAAIEQIKRTEEYRAIAPYLVKLPPRSRLLDGGCGLGQWTLFLAAKGFDVVGLDISRATVERLKERFPDRRFIVGDVRSTGFEDGYFDAYLSWGTFEHFEDGLGPCLQEAQRILRPGGYLFISVPFHNGRHLRRDRRALRKWSESFDREKGYTQPMRFYQWRLTRPELQREFEINGFRTLAVVPINKWQGLHRMVHHDLRIAAGTTLHRLAQLLLYPFVPRRYVAHMLLGIAQARERMKDEG